MLPLIIPAHPEFPFRAKGIPVDCAFFGAFHFGALEAGFIRDHAEEIIQIRPLAALDEGIWDLVVQQHSIGDLGIPRELEALAVIWNPDFPGGGHRHGRVEAHEKRHLLWAVIGYREALVHLVFQKIVLQPHLEIVWPDGAGFMIEGKDCGGSCGFKFPWEVHDDSMEIADTCLVDGHLVRTPLKLEGAPGGAVWWKEYGASPDFRLFEIGGGVWRRPEKLCAGGDVE